MPAPSQNYSHQLPADGVAGKVDLAEASGAWQTARQLPSRYYLTHFIEFLDVIEQRYCHTLEPTHLQFLEQFAALPSDAQCLYVRMFNRQGTLFDASRFRYREINNITAQFVELEQKGFCRRLDAQDLDQWLRVITRCQLLELVSSQCSSNSFRRSWTKPALVQFAGEHLNRDHSSVANAMASFVMQLKCDVLDYLLFLYFGKVEQGLGRFTLRDLGVVRTGSFRKDFQPRFDSREQALSSWFYCQRLQQVDDLRMETCKKWIEEIAVWPKPIGEQAGLMRHQLIYRLGERFEKDGDFDNAIQIWSLSDVWPATERRVRLVYRQGDRQEAEVALQDMIDDPSCDDELLFARDFYQRKFRKKRTSRITDILRNSRVLCLDESGRNHPEQAAADWFRARGATVYFTENRLWKSLFGLVFWPQLFDNKDAALFSDFDKRPADLDNGQFYRRFSGQIEQNLALFEDPPQLLRILLQRITRNYGVANGIFLWRENMLEELRHLLLSTPTKGLAAMMRRMAKDYAGNHSGYPDLMVIERDQARFVEIKAEGDQLRRNQLKQIVALEESAIAVEVNRVEWGCDPDQVYVVVDIETTGRRSAANRITEIAAVKMAGGKVIAEWQSLINPCRSIPASITGLTGISNPMVADAPLFQEIADAFDAFTEGAVFVAHNVRFDFGFISDEYRRINRTFRRPTLCTCVEMRKWYKGLRSYSLANLCVEYEIDLQSHHRAMCDARAASALLIMINNKRLAQD